MKLVYCDESGDPGYPKFQTPIFLQTFLYFSANNWRQMFEQILIFRRKLMDEYALSVRQEFHTREFLLNKKPYTNKFDVQTRVLILSKFLDLIIELSKNFDLQVINSVVIKDRIVNPEYNVFENCIKFGLQRIDNNIFFNKRKYKNFMLIVDEGYEISLRKLTRKMFRFNYVPFEDSSHSRQLKLESLVMTPFIKIQLNVILYS